MIIWHKNYRTFTKNCETIEKSETNNQIKVSNKILELCRKRNDQENILLLIWL